ncbi:cupin domain-containing protein [Microbaculum marinum]|uniref:Cupin domain-containing protein n=1 Tax=Microbaculum marinum TaxID=1764581 RepID=A0AAW9RPP2_9HYPH
MTDSIILRPGAGRRYDLGAMHAVFKADGPETGDRYCVSEWWLEPRSAGPGPHSHEENDELFHVIAGRPSVLVGDEWVDAPAGTFVRIPAGVTHDFENRTDRDAGLLNIFVPGGFEERMPMIVAWFEQNRSDARKDVDS